MAVLVLQIFSLKIDCEMGNDGKNFCSFLPQIPGRPSETKEGRRVQDLELEFPINIGIKGNPAAFGFRFIRLKIRVGRVSHFLLPGVGRCLRRGMRRYFRKHNANGVAGRLRDAAIVKRRAHIALAFNCGRCVQIARPIVATDRWNCPVRYTTILTRANLIIMESLPRDDGGWSLCNKFSM